ncbi:MAG: PBP1A family penicillin-binding protein [Thermotaleaceae bacterium]
MGEGIEKEEVSKEDIGSGDVEKEEVEGAEKGLEEAVKEEESHKNKEEKKVLSTKAIKIIRTSGLAICFLCFCISIWIIGFVKDVIKDVPDIDPKEINSLLSEHSIIYDAKGQELEMIQTIEFREIIEISKIPDQVKNAFIAIEDERFRTHKGIDIKRIIGALLINIKQKSPVQGASTITQQLIKNLYLREEVDRENLVNDMKRKIREAYLAMEMEKELSKDQILQTYLNTINLGQGAYGVQAAAKTYFDKDVEELTIAEGALIAGVTKNPSKNAPYLLQLSENIENNNQNLIGHIYLIGKDYGVLYNPDSLERQKIVLNKMKELGYVTEEEYQMALDEDIKESLRPRERENTEITSFFPDLVQKEAVEILMKQGMTKQEAEERLYKGGLRIYTTLDVDMQKKIEQVYENFGEILAGKRDKKSAPILTEWRRYNGKSGNLDRQNNLVDHQGNLLYFNGENMFTEEKTLIIEKSNYTLEKNTLEIKSNKFKLLKNAIGLKNFYSVDKNKNLVLHQGGMLNISDDDYKIGGEGQIIIKSSFLKKNPDFYEIDDRGNLLLSSKYFTIDERGVIQPQSALVILDHTTGKIKAMIGGRDVTGKKVLNRATDGYRQPGSVMKPLAVYLPALDNGYTADSLIDDSPHYDRDGKLWPRNWYSGYRGLTPLRKVAADSMNVATVKLLDAIGIDTSMEYLKKLGIINEEDPLRDSFISRQENKYVNDENLAALGLGGLTRGLSPLSVSAAYGAIANQGVYIKPSTIERILDAKGNILYEYQPEKRIVVEPEIANILTNILQDVISYGTGTRASLYRGNKKIPVAGKTGTTTAKADAWFAGYTPYYTAALWIGNDLPQLNLTDGSRMAATLWREVMFRIHEDLEEKSFNQ